jgi:hypothetical protein
MKLGRPQIRNSRREKSLATAANLTADRQNRSLFTKPTTLPPQFIKPLKTNHARLEKISIFFSLYLLGIVLDSNVAFDELPTLIEFSLIPFKNR